MTLEKLKLHIDAAMTGSIKPPPDAKLIPLLEQAQIELANSADVMSLVTSDMSIKILRVLDENSAIRYPSVPVLDTDQLDFDDEIALALPYLIASYVTKGEEKLAFRDEAERIISGYNFKLANTPEEDFE